LEGSYSTLQNLSLDQDQIFRESLQALEGKLFQAAHVLAWAAFVDYLHGYLIPEYLGALQTARPKWNLAA
jgi:hypothetical protein